jgi:hypothetical protein
MGLVIKKKNIKPLVISIIVLLIGGGIGATIIKEQIEKKTAERVYREQTQAAYNREYKDLVREYERYKESMSEAYSRDNRDYYRRQINKLVGETVLEEYAWSISNDEEKQILKLLEIKAWSRVYGLED